MQNNSTNNMSSQNSQVNNVLVLVVLVLVLGLGFSLFYIYKLNNEKAMAPVIKNIQPTSNADTVYNNKMPESINEEIQPSVTPAIVKKAILPELNMYAALPTGWVFSEIKGEGYHEVYVTPKKLPEGQFYPEGIVVKAEDYYKDNYNAAVKAKPGDDVEALQHAVDVKVTMKEPTMIAGYPAVNYIHDGVTTPKGEFGRGPVGYSHMYLINKNGKYIQISMTSMDVEFTKSHENTLQAFIDSIEFKK